MVHKFIFFLVSGVIFSSLFFSGFVYSENQSEQAYLFNDHSVFLMTIPSGKIDELVKTQETEFLSTIQFSPDQKNACLITGLKKYEATKLSLIDSVTWKKSELLKIEPTSVITKPFWSPDSKKFVVLVGYKEIPSGDFAHYEYYWLKLYDTEISKMTDIIKLMEPVSSISWSNDSSYLAFNGKEGNSYSLFILSLTTKKLSQPVTNLASDWVFKNLNFWNLGRDKLYIVNGSSVFSYESKDRKYQQIKKLSNQIVTQQWNGVQNLVAIISKDSENTSLDSIDLEQGILKNIDKGLQIDSPRWSWDGQKISYFVKNKELYSRIVVFDLENKQKIMDKEAGLIDIYPWDVDPNYSLWSNYSDSLVYVVKKEDQSQELALLDLVDESSSAILGTWDYIYNYGWSAKDDWIYVTGSITEKDYIEFIARDDFSKKIRKQDLKFISWRNNGNREIPGGKQSEKTNTPIGLIITILVILIIVGLVVFYTRFINKRGR